MFFSDIHSHLLYGADDGAGTYEEMISMVDAAYADGIRLLCATPHCCPDLFGNNREAIEKAFAELDAYCKEKHPDLKLFLGNELFYGGDGIVWIKNGLCRSLNGSKFVLVEFGIDEPEASILKSVNELFNKGYVPIIAHAERYFKLSVKQIQELRLGGVLIQVNATDMRSNPLREKLRLKKMFSKGLVDFVSTDTHDLQYRPPILSECYKYVVAKYGKEYADKIFSENGKRIFELVD